LLEQFAPCDLVLVEGFKRQPIPKLEIHRAAAACPLLFRHDEHIIAVATDELLDTSLPQFDLGDYDDIANFILSHLGLRGRAPVLHRVT
jgi:molybdopterin-guanine dinucleotide biosynthesis protein B